MALIAANLVYEYVAKLATGSGPGVNTPSPTTTWVANVGSNDITLQNASGNFAWNDSGSGWDGDGSTGDPYCLCADGTGDYGTFAAAPVTSDADFSIELWTYLAAGPPAVNTVFFTNVSGGTYLGVRYFVGTGGIGSWGIGNGSSYVYVNDSAAGYGAAWQHHVLTYDATGDAAIAYRNASGEDPDSAAFSPYTGASNLFSSSSSMNAMKLATMRVYSAVLSSDDVTANYAAGVTAASTDAAPPEFTGIRVTRHIGA